MTPKVVRVHTYIGEGKATPIAELGLIYHHIKCM